MSGEINPFGDMTDADLEALLRRAIWNTVIAGLLAALALWIATDWRNAAMLAAGAAISTASIYEWRRLVRFIIAKMDKKQAPRGTAVAVIFFLLRLVVFAAVIYGSLKCFRGSGLALLCGLALAVVTISWEAVRLLRS